MLCSGPMLEPPLHHHRPSPTKVGFRMGQAEWGSQITAHTNIGSLAPRVTMVACLALVAALLPPQYPKPHYCYCWWPRWGGILLAAPSHWSSRHTPPQQVLGSKGQPLHHLHFHYLPRPLQLPHCTQMPQLPPHFLGEASTPPPDHGGSQSPCHL